MTQQFQCVPKVLYSEQVLMENQDEITQLEKARFPSMVAHVPDKTCIWYDRKSIADTTNRFDKLVMVLSEMRGEMALSAKGDPQAKQRLEAKLYCAQLLINDHSKTVQKSLILEDSPRVFRTELLELEQEYKQTDQAGIFSSDITDMLAHVKAHKLILSPLIVKEIEDFVTLQTDECLEESTR
ncbi:Hypothetical predicted protein [Paramuricea clavata]|uniref:Uncharacterized protein n=1 Tax=Paramuricea clavata TaxID=317549 RepID=A0A6S7I4D9_PARCT|nr:Hypothetical predicted protein [Paramuricea clavata]